VAAWTADREAADVAERLQGVGVEAVPVADFADSATDPQLTDRGHLVPLDHPLLGPGTYERNGFRLSDAPGGYLRPSPLLGEDTTWVLGELLGLSTADQQRLAEDGALD
jgi:crotonobetainyl-CoA:carnitine CoA-transferase CaiB-like acyl-CoA transferase